MLDEGPGVLDGEEALGNKGSHDWFIILSTVMELKTKSLRNLAMLELVKQVIQESKADGLGLAALMAEDWLEREERSGTGNNTESVDALDRLAVAIRALEAVVRGETF